MITQIFMGENTSRPWISNGFSMNKYSMHVSILITVIPFLHITYPLEILAKYKLKQFCISCRLNSQSNWTTNIRLLHIIPSVIHDTDWNRVVPYPDVTSRPPLHVRGSLCGIAARYLIFSSAPHHISPRRRLVLGSWTLLFHVQRLFLTENASVSPWFYFEMPPYNSLPTILWVFQNKTFYVYLLQSCSYIHEYVSAHDGTMLPFG